MKKVLYVPIMALFAIALCIASANTVGAKEKAATVTTDTDLKVTATAATSDPCCATSCHSASPPVTTIVTAMTTELPAAINANTNVKAEDGNKDLGDANLKVAVYNDTGGASCNTVTTNMDAHFSVTMATGNAKGVAVSSGDVADVGWSSPV